LRVKGALVTMVAVLAWVSTAAVADALALASPLFSSAQESSQAQNPESQPTALFKINSYQGLIVRSIKFAGIDRKIPRDRLDSFVVQKVGQPLSRDLIRQSIQAIYDTGRVADVQVQAERTPDGQVDLTFVVAPNYFVGDVRAEGAPDRPSEAQIVNASKFQLGESFTPEKMNRALKSIQQLLEENGYHRATLFHQETEHPETQQIDILFRVRPGSPAHVGRVIVAGNPGFSQSEIQEIAGIDPGDRVSPDRVTRALQRLRKKYQKQNRLLAQVSVAERTYHPKTNSVDCTFQIDPGPIVDIGVEGFRIARGVLKKNVPIYIRIQ